MPIMTSAKGAPAMIATVCRPSSPPKRRATAAAALIPLTDVLTGVVTFTVATPTRPPGAPGRTTLAVTLSVLVHGLSTAPLSAWLQHREPERKQEKETTA